jgi:hypothetical protein
MTTSDVQALFQVFQEGEAQKAKIAELEKQCTALMKEVSHLKGQLGFLKTLFVASIFLAVAYGMSLTID